MNKTNSQCTEIREAIELCATSKDIWEPSETPTVTVTLENNGNGPCRYAVSAGYPVCTIVLIHGNESVPYTGLGEGIFSEPKNLYSTTDESLPFGSVTWKIPLADIFEIDQAGSYTLDIEFYLIEPSRGIEVVGLEFNIRS